MDTQAPPSPYLSEDADWWIDKHKGISDEVMRELEEEEKTNPDGLLKFVETCPVRIIREIKADGTDLYLGDIGVDRCRYEELQGEKKEIKTKENISKTTGDPSIVWSVGGTQHKARTLQKD